MGQLHVAARDGNADQLSTLLAAGTAVDTRDHINRTALHLAAFAGQVPWQVFKQAVSGIWCPWACLRLTYIMQAGGMHAAALSTVLRRHGKIHR